MKEINVTKPISSISLLEMLEMPPNLKPIDPYFLRLLMSSSEMKIQIKVLNKSKDNETKQRNQ